MLHLVLASARDDDRILVEALSASRPEEWRTTICQSGRDAALIVSSAAHDVCLVDERVAGDEADLFAASATSGRPLLVLVDSADDATDERWFAAGAWDCLVRSELSATVLARIGHRARLHLRHARMLEERSAQSQKMEAIGRLAGGVAHDFNNLLTAITGYTSLLLDQAGPEHPWRPHLLEISKAAERGGALTRQLGGFSREEPAESRVVDLNLVVRDMHKLLRRLIGEDVAIDRIPDPKLGQVRVDASQIGRVIMNLAINARDAMPNGGRLTIETANVDLDSAYAREHPGSSPGPHVMVAVTDTGTGMTPEVMRRLFEPFFTTKPTGVGLGLATAYTIVRQAGGSIWPYSEPGRGTSFKVYLPRVDATNPPSDAPGASTVSMLGSETVLVVEDDPAVRDLTREILEEHGYRVLTATNGQDALDVAAAHAGEIHVVLTDIVMPVMNGRELVRRIVWTRRTIKVIYTSGYTEHTAVEENVLEPTPSFLQKPYTPDRLLGAVRKALDEA